MVRIARWMVVVAALAWSPVTVRSAAPTPARSLVPHVSALPLGFTDTGVPVAPSNPLASPTAITPLPGGRALVLEKAGAVRILAPDGTVAAPDALTLAVCTISETGLLGAAVDPEYLTNGYIYLYYTRSAGNCAAATGRVNRVSRFTMAGDSFVAGSEVVLLDNIPATGGNHDGGDLAVGQDGDLYVSIGDAGTNPRGTAGSSAQDLSLLTGKIVRITTTGAAPADNPFVGVANAVTCATAGLSAPVTGRCVEIYAWGLRNPYRFAFDPNTGATKFLINDVGQNTWEEVDEGGPGRNYGWNAREGGCLTGSTTTCPAPPAGVTDPVIAYSHPSTGCSYVTAGAFVPNGIWPQQFDGAYLFADGGCNKIWQRSATGSVDFANPFQQVAGGIVDMAFVTQGADPALFYVTVGSNEVRKITYDAPAATTSPALAYTPLSAARRAYDTRSNIGVAAGTVRADTTRLIDLGVTDPSVTAALVNLTMDAPAGAAHLTAWQPRTEYPPTSNINAAPHDVVANAAIVPVDADGRVLLYASGTTHVIVDVLGTFGPVGAAQVGGRFVALPPQRLIDTREPASATNAFSTSGRTVHAAVAGRAGVPAGDVSAVALIVTGLSGPAPVPGHVTVYPGGAAVPPSSNLNVNGNLDIRPNLVLVPLGADGSVDAELVATDAIVVDVAGYVRSGATGAGLYHLIAPSRQIDTRTSLGIGAPFAPAGSATFDAAAPIPDAAVAISQNVTITNPAVAGFVTAYPAGQALPLASNANASGPDQDRAALSLTKLGNGRVTYYSSGGTDLVVDITGYFD